MPDADFNNTGTSGDGSRGIKGWTGSKGPHDKDIAEPKWLCKVSFEGECTSSKVERLFV
jgi:hypothetical protein